MVALRSLGYLGLKNRGNCLVGDCKKRRVAQGFEAFAESESTEEKQFHSLDQYHQFVISHAQCQLP